MKKKITVIGTGYVGLVTSAGLAELGHQVTAVDVDFGRIRELKKGIIPFYEPGLKKLVRSVLTEGRIDFTNDCSSAVEKADAVFIAVGTPRTAEGRVDLRQINKAVDSVVENISDYKTIVIKSTVPPGTSLRLKERILFEADTNDFDLVFCPEFLREGTAVRDFFYPDRIVFGADSERAFREMNEIYFPIISREVPVLKCSQSSAELIKYGSNVMLAARVAVINELAEISEAVSADIEEVSAGIGMDKRIGPDFLKAGPGFGGSCFGKDIEGLVSTASKVDLNLSLISEITVSNDRQKRRVVSMLSGLAGGLVKGKTITVLGLSFKEDTDDVRDSSAFPVISELLNAGAFVQAHDPEASINFAAELQDKRVTYFETAEEALSGADAVILLTAWDEYRDIDAEKAGTLMNDRIVVDARNFLDKEAFRKAGFKFQAVGSCAALGRQHVPEPEILSVR